MNMDEQIITSRLILRPFAETDARAVSDNSKQPIAARFLSDMVFGTEADARGWINAKRNMKEPFQVLAPAFMISELKRAFEIGFMVFLPFLVIDLVVASVLMSMGMMMLPPVVVSLPFKLIFFVLVDGWRLVAGSLVESFQRGAGG